MADQPFLASNSFDGDGSTLVWEFSFEGLATDAPLTAVPYIHPDDVRAEFITGTGDDQVTVQQELVLETANSIRLSVAPPVGTALRIYRVTENRFPLVNYQDLQSVGASDLDLANRQAVYIVQEARDAARGAGNLSAEALAIALGAAQDAAEDAAEAAASAAAAEAAAEIAGSADALRAELADDSTAAVGAGMMGFLSSLSYAAGTVGAALKSVVGGLFSSVKVGTGIKGNPQTNVGVQVVRDITAASPSYHGVNVADYFAGDGNALNPFGSDIQIGDGTQVSPFNIGHVNDFQVTDIIDLGTGALAQHFPYISQSVLKSGTVARTRHFSAIDNLGVRDTPGFGVADFEDNGPAVSNNQTGLSTIIRHGTNAKSLHIQAGSTDAGATKTSGGAVSDFETQIIVRQATASTSKASGALLLTAGGIGCSGSVFAGAEVSAGDANPQLALRDASNVLRGRMTHDGTIMRVRGEVGTTLQFGVNATDRVELLTDRFRPVTDNTINCGDASHRWIQLFAMTATVSTSDANAKTEPMPIDDALLDAWGHVTPVLFQFKDAVERKGEDARIHIGYIAQQVRDTLADHGIDGFRYALLCEDEVTEEVTEYRTVKVPRVERVPVEVEKFELVDGMLIRTVEIVEEDRPVTEQKLVYNPDGTPYLAERIDYREEVVRDKRGAPTKRIVGVPVLAPVEQTVQVFDEVQEPFTVTVKTGEKRMGLRYQHLATLDAAYIRRELARLNQE